MTRKQAGMFARAFHFLSFRAALLLTLGLAPVLESLVTIEWSRAYCLNPADGPDYAAKGMPLPYEMYSGVSSMEFSFMPHVYLLNLAILCLCLFPLVRRLLDGVVGSSRQGWRAVLGGVGLILWSACAAATMLLLHIGALRPVASIGDDGYGRYADFRPVALAWRSRDYDCTPSPYWFPGGWPGK